MGKPFASYAGTTMRLREHFGVATTIDAVLCSEELGNQQMGQVVPKLTRIGLTF